MMPGDTTGLFGRYTFPSDLPNRSTDGNGDDGDGYEHGDEDAAIRQALALCAEAVVDADPQCAWDAVEERAQFEKLHPDMSSHSTLGYGADHRDAWNKADSLDHISCLPRSPTFVDPSNFCCAKAVCGNAGDPPRRRCVKCLVKCAACGHGDVAMTNVPKCKYCPLAIPVIPNECPCGKVGSCDYRIVIQ